MMRKKVGRVVSNVYRTFECKSFCIKFEIFYFFLICLEGLDKK